MAYSRRNRGRDDHPVFDLIAGFFGFYFLAMLGLYVTNKVLFWEWVGWSCLLAIIISAAAGYFVRLQSMRKQEKLDGIINDLKRHGLEGDVTSFIDSFGLQKKPANSWKYDRYSFSLEQMERFRKFLNEEGMHLSTDKWDDLSFVLRYYIEAKEDRFMRDSVSMAPKRSADLSGSAFEDLLVQLYGAMGYSVQKIGKTGDAGCDLVVNMDNERVVIQAKRYSNRVGIAAVQEANTAKPIYNCSRAMVVATSNFTKEAYEAARANNVKLVEGDELEALLSRYLKQNWK